MRRALPALFLLAFSCAAPAGQPTMPRGPTVVGPEALSPTRVARLRAYVRASWETLTRTARDLPSAAQDAKVPHVAGTPWPVYVARDEDLARIEAALRAELDPAAMRAIELRVLPADLSGLAGSSDLARGRSEHGLLYLPRPYVVPGGRFNEMYGWDSYFIVLGLIDDGQVGRARDVVDDFLYEVAHYGGVLNANRTYYLTRGQPPLLGAMVLAVANATGDDAWLAAARPAVEATWRHYTSPPHLIEPLGLSRYYDHGDGPAPEVVAAERDARGRTHYDRVRDFFRGHAAAADDVGYPIEPYYRRATDELLPLFYKGDRSMRESGFDPSDRFGSFGADVIHYVPVCLNSLLYLMEGELGEIDTRLGRGTDAATWTTRAAHRQTLIDRFLWDERAGLYFDYNFETGRRRAYPFATTFWPLSAGLASPAQARRVRDGLPLLERPGGVVTSTKISGSQWDAPYGWAPLQLFAVQGLRRYGFRADADRIARAFLSMLVEDFERRGTLVEKYDVERRSSDLGGGPSYGYTSNEVGFGWTNGVALDLLKGLGK